MTREEAIEMLRNNVCNSHHVYDNALPTIREALETLIPEIAESEDERIRKEMVEYFKHYSGGDNVSIKFPKWIAYLEKQKINTDGDFARGYDCGYECCLNSHGAEWFEKQKEQKPAEWSEDDKLMRTLVIKTLEMFGGVGTTGMQIDWLKSLPERFNPQSKQEWNEEDERMLERAFHIMAEYSDIDEKESEAVQNWLKSFHERATFNDASGI